MGELRIRCVHIGLERARDAIVAVCIECKQVVPKEVMAAPLGKRKTPTELRLEQSKRHQLSKVGGQHEPADTQGFVLRQRDAALPSRVQDDPRVADIYSPVNPGDKLRFHPLRGHKEKDTSSVSQHETSLYEAPVFGKVCSDSISLFSRHKSSIASSNGSTKVGTQHDGGGKEDLPSKGEEKVKGLHDCTFRDVRDISNSQSLLKAETSIDMVEALKKLAPRKALGPFDFSVGPPLPTNFCEADIHNDQSAADNGPSAGMNTFSRSGFPMTSGLAEDAQAWVPINGSHAPLDLSLKLLARFTSPDSLHWCHRLSTTVQCDGVQQFAHELGVMNRKTDKVRPVACSVKSGGAEKLGSTFWKSLHSWIYPQSSLPPAVLSVIASAAARGGEAVCMQQFVAMFVGGGVGGRDQGACTAYLTRSTRGVRQLLLEHDIKFSMPFSASEVPTTTVEDLQELLEFEKSNPGQTRVVNERAASDNGPQSMLCFEGFSNVHRLYDFLLNHRSLLHSTAATDVPVLYAPTAFDNASLSVPEITCKQLQRTDGLTKLVPQVNNGKKNVSLQCTEPASNTTYTMEMKGTLLPPWVIIRLCTVLQDSQPLGFSARFSTEPLTEGLNVAQEEQQTDTSKPANFKNFFQRLNGITNRDTTISETKAESSTVSPEFTHASGVGAAVVKELKYEGGSYTAVLAPLQLATSY